MDNIYLARAWRYVEADPVRGINESRHENSSYSFVIATGEGEAGDKLLTDLREHTRFSNWKDPDIKELSAGLDIPLEKRVEILREIYPVIE